MGLRDVPYPEASEALQSLPGVGPKVLILLFPPVFTGIVLLCGPQAYFYIGIGVLSPCGACREPELLNLRLE
jgi:hypothetical protein